MSYRVEATFVGSPPSRQVGRRRGSARWRSTAGGCGGGPDTGVLVGGSRVLEAGAMFAGVMCLLAVVTLRQAGAGADALVTSHALVAMYDRTFLISCEPCPCSQLLVPAVV